MPWEHTDAPRFTKKANTPAKQRQWRDVANSELERTGDESLAIKAANSAIKHHPAVEHRQVTVQAKKTERRQGDGVGHWSGH